MRCAERPLFEKENLTRDRYAFVCARTRTIVSDTQNCVKKKVNMRREGVLEMGRELDDAVAAAT